MSYPPSLSTSTHPPLYPNNDAGDVPMPPPPPQPASIIFAPLAVPGAATAESTLELDNTDLELDDDLPSDSDAMDFDRTSDYWSATTGVHTTESIVSTSSLLSNTRAHGRRYHTKSYASLQYLLPNDEIEQERLDLTHYWFMLQSNGHLYRAPLQVPSAEDVASNRAEKFRILDCGTGTGSWALDVGDLHEGSVEVLGVDLSPIQPRWSAKNVEFQVDDLEEETWTWEEGWFDFVYSRTVLEGIKDIPRYFRNIYKHLKPGGYVELWEHQYHTFTPALPHSPPPPTCSFSRLFALYALSRSLSGHPIDFSADFLRTSLEAAGFVDVTVKRFKQPFGEWAKEKRMKEIGRSMLEVMETGLEAHVMALLVRFGGVAEGEVRRLCEGALGELRGGVVKVWNESWNIVGRRPMEGEIEEESLAV